jgi:hypothetical protein
MWFFTVMHNNMLTNIRLACSTSFHCKDCGWNLINWVVCKLGTNEEGKGCQMFCQDNCGKKASLIKMIFQTLLFSVLSMIMFSGASKCNAVDVANNCDAISSLATTILLFGTINLIFVLARVAITIVLSIACCCLCCADEEAEEVKLAEDALTLMQNNQPQPREEDQRVNWREDVHPNHFISYNY